MVDAIWIYEKDVQNGERYPECPYWSYYVEIIDLDFTDKNRINEGVADMEKDGSGLNTCVAGLSTSQRFR
jgi:hypothetical protein